MLSNIIVHSCSTFKTCSESVSMPSVKALHFYRFSLIQALSVLDKHGFLFCLCFLINLVLILKHLIILIYPLSPNMPFRSRCISGKPRFRLKIWCHSVTHLPDSVIWTQIQASYTHLDPNWNIDSCSGLSWYTQPNSHWYQSGLFLYEAASAGISNKVISRACWLAQTPSVSARCVM